MESSTPSALRAVQLRGPSILFSVLAALTLFSYACARSASESLFLIPYGRDALPGLWLEVGLAVVFTVWLYNRQLRRASLFTLYQHALWGSAGSLFLLLLFLPALDGDSRGAYLGPLPIHPIAAVRVWCDIYIILLVEVFWSLTNLTFSTEEARSRYGLLAAAGTGGSIAGNIFSGAMAEQLGSLNLIYLAVPSLILMSAFVIALKRSLSKGELFRGDRAAKEKSTGRLLDSMNLVMNTRRLRQILGLVLLSQFVVALIDYEYQGLLRFSYPDEDQRTVVSAWLYTSIDIGSLSMQALTALLLTRLGIAGTLSLIPLLLAGLCLPSLFFPLFILSAAAKSASKFFTYSIFKAAKELLYIPLTYRAQTEGKAVIDIMGYRLAKIVIALPLLALAGLSRLGEGEQPWLQLAPRLLLASCLAAWFWLAWCLRAELQKDEALDEVEQLS